MILADVSIKKMGDSLISPFQEAQLGALCYDLISDRFFTEEGKDFRTFDLMPAASVFVQCRESINLPANIAARVILRNSRIRQGLALTAPVYHPGHNTPVFFRVTNMTSKVIELHEEDCLASIMFEQLTENTTRPYEGTFQNESKYKGMGRYSDIYKKNMKEIDDKIDSVKHIERGIYSNVLAIMSIFIAAFTILNINVTLTQSNTPLSSLIIFNLCTLGSIAFLIGLVNKIVNSEKKCGYCLFLVGALAFIAAVLIPKFI